jgi:hypothetical protein
MEMSRLSYGQSGVAKLYWALSSIWNRNAENKKSKKGNKGSSFCRLSLCFVSVNSSLMEKKRQLMIYENSHLGD